jgi:hypothetical protein
MDRYLVVVRRFTTQAKAEASIHTFEVVLSPVANPRVVFIGPGRYPWGVVAESVAVDAAMKKEAE